MKKLSLLVLFLSPALIFMNACRKEGVTVTKVIYVNLNANESYSDKVLHAGDADDVMVFSKQADHAATCTLMADPSNGDASFKYTPAPDFTGTDEVKINNEEGTHHGSGMHRGSCSHHHEDITIYDYKITVTGNIH